jgi:hypothetical protein
MADFHRVIRSLIYLIFGIFIGAGITFDAYADTAPATHGYRINNISSTTTYPTGLAACQGYAASGAACYGGTCAGITWEQSQVYADQGFCKATNNLGNSFAGTTYDYFCPAGSTKTGSGASTVCTYPTSCPAGQIRLPNGSCSVDCSVNPDDKVGNRFQVEGAVPATLCSGGCTYTRQSATVCTDFGCLGYWGSKTGATCSTETTQAGNSPKFDCLSQGKTYGTVNGTTVCLAPGTSGAPPVTTNQPTSTTNTSSGGNNTTTTKNTTYTVNNNGTVTSTTTTTTITNGGTPSTTTEQKSEPKESFCNENPELRICKDGNFSGSCGSYQCDGDAATCALAKKFHQDRCDDLEDTDQSTLGKQIFEGNDPEAGNNPANEANRDTIDMGTTLNESAEFGGGCPQDKFVTVLGKVITIPFSSMCSTLEILGSIVLAFSFVAAGRIVGAY